MDLLICYLSPILIGVLLILLSLPNVDRNFRTFMPNRTYNLLAKVAIVMVVVFLLELHRKYLDKKDHYKQRRVNNKNKISNNNKKDKEHYIN
jgi:hypothetical protein